MGGWGWEFSWATALRPSSCWTCTTCWPRPPGPTLSSCSPSAKKVSPGKVVSRSWATAGRPESKTIISYSHSSLRIVHLVAAGPALRRVLILSIQFHSLQDYCDHLNTILAGQTSQASYPDTRQLVQYPPHKTELGNAQGRKCHHGEVPFRMQDSYPWPSHTISQEIVNRWPLGQQSPSAKHIMMRAVQTKLLRTGKVEASTPCNWWGQTREQT